MAALYPPVEPQILRRPTAGQHQSIVRIGLHFIKRCIQPEPMPGLFRVRLVPLEVMDGGPHRLSGFLPRTHGVDRMPGHPQCLEWHHDLVILDVITHQHQDLLCGHLGLYSSCLTSC